MGILTISPLPTRADVLIFTLFTLSAGFCAGWVTHRAAAWAPVPVSPRSSSCKTALPVVVMAPWRASPPACTYGLAEDEADCPGASTALIRVAPFRYLLDRRVFSCLLSPRSGPTRLAANLRMFFKTGNGHPEGIALYAVRPGNLFARLGFQNGDIVYSINGMSIANADRALAAYSRLRTASHFTVELWRNRPGGGKSIRKIDYDLF
jgi:hypothetical protein